MEIKPNETNSSGFEPGHPFTVSDGRADVHELRPHPANSYAMEPAEIEVLAENIREMGLIQPLAVRRVADGGLQILAGHRRHAALCRLAKRDPSFSNVPVRIYEGLSDQDALLILHSSNISRNLTPDERRRQSEELARRVDDLRASHPEWKGVATTDIIGQMLGMTGRTYRTKLRMADKLDPKLHEYMERSILSQREAVKLAKLPAERQSMVAEVLDRACPKTTREASAVIENLDKSVAEYLQDFEAALRQADEAYFRLREAMAADGHLTYVEKESLARARRWIDGMLDD